MTGSAPRPRVVVVDGVGEGDVLRRERIARQRLFVGVGRLEQDRSRLSVQEGHAREIVNRVQNTRKRAGLDVADRVVVHMGGAPALIAAARQHEDLILGEVLGVRLEYMDEGGQGAESFDIDGAALQVSVERTEN